jgi:hypothetical protein
VDLEGNIAQGGPFLGCSVDEIDYQKLQISSFWGSIFLLFSSAWEGLSAYE